MPQTISLLRSYREQSGGTVFAKGSYSAWDLERLTLVPEDSCVVYFDEGDSVIDFDIYMPPVNTAMNEPFLPPDNRYLAPFDKYFSGWELNTNHSFHPKGQPIVMGNVPEVTLTAQYADGDNIWIGGTLVTPLNRSDVLGDGTVSYDPETGILTLDHLEGIRGSAGNVETYGDPALPDALIYAKDRNLTISIQGSVSLGDGKNGLINSSRISEKPANKIGLFTYYGLYCVNYFL